MVRSFPRTPFRRQAVVLGVAAALVCAPLLTPAASADDLKSRQHKVHRQVKGARADLDESSKALTSARTKLAGANRELASARTKLVGTQHRLASAQVADRQAAARLAGAQRRLSAAQAAVTAAKQAVADQKRAIGQLIAASYSYGDPQLMRVSAVLGATTPDEMTSQLGTIDSLMSRRTEALAQLRKKQQTLTAQRAAVAAAEKTVAHERQDAADKLAATQQLEQAAAADAASVRTVVATRSAAAATAARVRKADVRELKALQAREAKIKKQILARAAKQKNQHVANLGNGFLMRPVPGYITSPYGWRIHPIYHYWGLHDGDDFHAPCGTPERAARAGTVSQEYYSSVWGNRLYLDLGKVNGHNYTVIYNHLSSYVAHTGQRVKRGQTVGLAGTTGWSTGCHLHFTVMKDGVAVNPTQFF